MCRDTCIPYFKINPPICCCPLYYPSPSQLISRINPLIFLWTPKGFISPESFLNFFLNLYIPPWLQKSFKFIVVWLLADILVNKNKKIVSVYFTHARKQKSSFYHYPPLPPRQKEITHSSQTAFSKVLFCPQQYWSQVLINSTIFATFTFLVSVLFCHNLASSMLKCEGALT